MMAVCPPFHSVAPDSGGLYHNNSSCSIGREIRVAYLREGLGPGRTLCAECVKLDVGSWRNRRPDDSTQS